MTDQTDKLRTLNGELCAEINEKERRIRELESENDELLEAWSNQAKTIYEQIKRIDALESLVRDMLFAIRLGSMSDLTDRDVLKSWLRDFSERAFDLGLMEVNG